MGLNFSQGSIFLLTFLVITILVVIVKKNRNLEQDVVVYSLGFKEFEQHGDDDEHEVSGLLHISQVLKKADTSSGNLTVVQVDFPKNGLDYIIMLVKVLNYNSEKSSAQLVRENSDDSNFWVLVSEGAIGSNSVTVEINSLLNIDADVEFYGYKENAKVL